MTIEFKYSRSKIEVKEIISARLSALTKTHSSEISSHDIASVADGFDFRLKVKGFDIKGKIIIQPSFIRIDVSLPFFLFAHKNKIKEAISSELQRIL